MLTIMAEAIHASPVLMLVAMHTNVGYQQIAATLQTAVDAHLC